MATDITNQTVANAQGPKEVTNADGVKVVQHSLREQMEMDRYLASNTAASKRGFGVAFARIKFGGAA